MSFSLNNIYVELGKQEILKNINIKIKKGSFVSILGPSGCGKSTMLKTIAGIVDIKNGTIILDNKNIENEPVNKRNIVMIFQDLRLFPHMNVWENISFGLKMEKVKLKDRKEKAFEMIKLVKLEGFENFNINNLSGG